MATDVIISGSQIDIIVSSILICSCCLAWCLGFLAHEMGGK